MAEEEFFTLDDDELEDEVQNSSEDKDIVTQSGKNNKIIHYAIIGILILIITLFSIFAYLYIQKKNEQKVVEVNATKIIQNIQEKKLTPQEENKTQKLLKKADKLFAQGKRAAALEIYEELSHYNKALSFYNIGVAKLKEKSYQEAINSFEKWRFLGL